MAQRLYGPSDRESIRRRNLWKCVRHRIRVQFCAVAPVDEESQSMKFVFLTFTLGLGFVLTTPTLAADKQTVPAIPDFTQGATVAKDGPHDWTLGPTGARGWIYTANGHSADARQILVTAVDDRSPAASVLQVGDVILGTAGSPFSRDARIEFANAIASAETHQGKGQLKLTRWRTGIAEEVAISLPILGSYSPTAPYVCTKSDRIFELGCESLARRMSNSNYSRGIDPIPRSLNALALLSSGKKEYLPIIQREARWASEFKADSFATWYYGYLLQFLGEYAIATGDTSIMPGLERLALEAARGQSSVGTWGHKFALPTGNLNGYGCMNQPGISLCIGMVLAREAGVDNPILDRAIAKASNFVRWFIHKGAIPYGDHQPFPAHEDNGKCSSAAVLFDLLGDKEATEFFAKMSTAAYSERERGHTGNFFNVLWALPGVARCGNEATGAYLKEQSWYYDLARSWDTQFLYQGSPVGEEEHGSYKGWDCTGGYLLAYALPRKSLRLTGKKPFCTSSLSTQQVEGVIQSGRGFAYKNAKSPYEQRSMHELLEGLSSWSPAVRLRSATELGRRQETNVADIIPLLTHENRDARYGACIAMSALGPRADSAAPQLRALLHDDDPWLQSLAAEALPTLSEETRTACVSDLLAMAFRTHPSDPRRMAQRSAAIALFAPYPGQKKPRSILAQSLEGVNRELLYPAMQTLLQNEDSVARSSVAKVYDELSDRDLAHMLPAIIQAIEKLAPSNEMFGDGVRLSGLDLLSRLHVQEGLELCVSVLEPNRWGAGKRIDPITRYLARYGVHAKAVRPELLRMRLQLAASARSKSQSDFLEKLDQCIANIDASTETPTLVSVVDFKK
jgi:HEAT repeat protein